MTDILLVLILVIGLVIAYFLYLIHDTLVDIGRYLIDKTDEIVKELRDE